MQSNNILSFPISANSPNYNKDAEDMRLSLIEQKKTVIDDLVDYHSSNLIAGIGMSGINVGTDNFIRDFGFITECLKSCFYRSAGIYHPLQESVDILVTIEDSEPYGDPWDPLEDNEFDD